jgi:fructose-1,6-bisphosphatase I / sedoheptulose-1,7-bisphosphatase
MLPSNRRTLTQYLIEQRRRFPNAGGALNALILDVSLACKAIARSVAFGALGDPATASLAGGEQAAGLQPALGRISQRIFVNNTEWSGNLAGMASEHDGEPGQIGGGYPRGKYLLLFDPLDGAGGLDVNVPVGSIFSILRAPQDVIDSGRPVVEADFLQLGSRQVAAGYALYGPTTMLVLTVGNGVVGFTLDPNLGEFRLTHDAFAVPADAQEFAINTSHSRYWEPPIKRYVDECLAGRSGPRGQDFNMRWVASMVAEAHRILMRGGVVLYPRDSRGPAGPGSLCLLFEAHPIGFLIEQAGGRASTGRQPVLGVLPSALHQHIGTVFGSKNEVERIERYHRDPATREATAPLFAERSLFRD